MVKDPTYKRGASDALRAAWAAQERGERAYATPVDGGTDPAIAQAIAHDGYMVCQAIMEIFGGFDGWLRASPQEDGVVYWKWKFTVAPWSNHYVMYRQERFESTTVALRGLADKVERVRCGVDKPTEDRYYR